MDKRKRAGYFRFGCRNMNLLSSSLVTQTPRLILLAVVLFLTSSPSTAWAADDGGGNRAIVLLLDAARDWFRLLGVVMLFAVAGGVAGFFIGTGAGAGLWLWLRKRGWLDTHWRWYRYFRWGWPVLLVMCLSIGMAVAGMLCGTGWKLRRAVQHDRLIDRTTLNIYGAVVCLHNPKGFSEQNATALLQQDIDRLIAQTRAMGEQAQAVREKAKNTILDAGKTAGVSGLRRFALSKSIDWFLDDQIQKQFTDKEWGAVVLYALGQSGGTAPPVSNETFLAPLRKQAVAAIDAAIWSHVFIVLAVAFGVPALCLGVFRLLVRLTRPPPSASPPPIH